MKYVFVFTTLTIFLSFNAISSNCSGIVTIDQLKARVGQFGILFEVKIEEI